MRFYLNGVTATYDADGMTSLLVRRHEFARGVGTIRFRDLPPRYRFEDDLRQVFSEGDLRDLNETGQLTSEKYPSGKIVTNSYDANGRLAGIADQSRTYLTGLQYQGLGNSLNSMSFGNGTVQSFLLNDRLQMSQQELKRGSEVLQKYVYNYGQIDTATGAIAANSNNGQLAKVESFIGAAKQWEQRFGYDSIGRLKEAREIRGDNGSLTYKQVFDFDRFGNMYRKVASNPTTGQANPLPYTPIEENTDISKSSNRLTSNTSYDDAGNVVTDNKFRTMGFGYDANGRMIKATKTSVPDALSTYDASGQRVAEKVNDIWRFLIYDLGGKLVAEYGGLQSTDEGGVKYLLSDWQGSTRAVVSNTGFVTGRSDYTAFGEEIGSGTGLRTAAQGFGVANNLRQKYGLTERDDATGLDHTWFRKNENRAGRWTSPDPYKGSMSLGDPQSFNRYSYVGNEPTNFVDPSGLLRVWSCSRIWFDTAGGRVYLDWICTLIYDDGGGGSGGSGGGGVIEPGGGGGGGGSSPINDPYLEFDGCKINYIDEKGNVARSWAAVSGNPRRNYKPIPTGTYTVDPSQTESAVWFSVPVGARGGFSGSIPVYRPWANTQREYDSWGDFRTPIVGDAGGRGGFYIHGGKEPGSAGCIDLTSGNNDFHERFKNLGRKLTLVVTDKCNPWK